MQRKSTLLLCSLLCTCGVALAQARQIKGRVISSEDQEPIIGANVIIKDKPTIGAATDLDGKFAISVPSGSKTLVVSYIGFASRDISVPASGKGELLITLEPDSKLVDEVIVVAYGQQKKSAYAGAVSNVKASGIASAKVESVDKALAGKLSGVRIASATDELGGAGQIQIRGIGSITGSTQPLFVVDGVPVVAGNFGIASGQSSNILASINPNDIESLTVLKDAAAASLYGSRAANGVVVIKTKQGQAGKTRFNLRASRGWSDIATKSFYPLTAKQYREHLYDALVGRGLLINQALVPGDKNYGTPEAQAQAEAYAKANLEAFSPVKSDEQGDNWRDKIFDGGYRNEIQLSASGGNDKTRFFASLGVDDAKGVAALSTYRRYSSLLNLDHKANDRLSLSFKSQLSHSLQVGRWDKGEQGGGFVTSSPVFLLFASRPDAKVYNEDGSYNLESSYNSSIQNAIYQLDPSIQKISTETFRNITDIGVTYKITKDLSFKSTNSLDYTSVKGFDYLNPKAFSARNTRGYGNRLTNTLYTLTTSNVLSWAKDLGERHRLDALAGYEAQKFTVLTEDFSVKNYSNDKLEELSNGQADGAESSRSATFLRSFFGNVNYSYDSRYYLGASLRSDESSRLGKDKRQGIFWSVSGAWRFGNEAFFKNDLITDAKLRFSLGTNGNLPTGYYASLPLYYFGGSYNDKSASYFYQLENPNLSWEHSVNFNLGLDLTLSKRVNLTLEYFHKQTNNLLLDVPTTWGTGVGSQIQNAGSIVNKGIELELHARDILNHKDFKWDADFTLSTLKATVKSLPGGDIVTGNHIYREGEDLYSVHGRSWHGVNPENGLAQFLIDPTKPATEDNLTYNGMKAEPGPLNSTYPKVFGGLTNIFNYKGFTLRTHLTYQFGGYLIDFPNHFLRSDGVRMLAINQDNGLWGNYWRQPGDKKIYPRPITLNPLRSDVTSNRSLLSTDFIRLKEISLSYRLPETLYRKLGFTAVDLSVSATNLLFLYSATKNKIEPEVAINGYRPTDTPLARTISLGINVSF